MPSPEYTSLTVTTAARVATLTLDRPQARNALDMQLKGDLARALSVVADDPEVRAVVLTGAGRAFCAGGDIGEMTLNDRPVRSRDRLQRLLDSVVIPLAELEKPTIAAVNGPAHGAGLSLALACDLIVASADAVLSCAFSRLGLLPDCGALYFLPRRLGAGAAKELVLTGRPVDAQEALSLGLVDRVVPADELTGVVGELAARLAAAPTVALGLTKRLLDRSLSSSLHEMATLEALGQAMLYSTEDHLAARDAFHRKTTPAFHGR